jgi:hypothetical protein
MSAYFHEGSIVVVGFPVNCKRFTYLVDTSLVEHPYGGEIGGEI